MIFLLYLFHVRFVISDSYIRILWSCSVLLTPVEIYFSGSAAAVATKNFILNDGGFICELKFLNVLLHSTEISGEGGDCGEGEGAAKISTYFF